MTSLRTNNEHLSTLRSSTVTDPTLHLELSGWWRRVGATVLDSIVISMVTWLLFRFISSIVVHTLCSALLAGAYRVFFLSSARGQTFGNRAAGTAVKSGTTGERVSVGQAVVHWLVQMLPAYILLGVISHPLTVVRNYMATQAPNTVPSHYPAYVTHNLHTIGIAGVIYLAYTAVDSLLPLWDHRRRTLHDRVAGTIVQRVL